MQSVCRRLLHHLCFAMVFLPGLVSAHALEIHGSNTIGATLAPMLMTRFLEQLSGQPVISSASGTENETLLSTSKDGKPLTVLVAAHGSSTCLLYTRDTAHQPPSCTSRQPRKH